MGKDSKRMRKELRRFAKEKVDALNPRDVVWAFIEECMNQSLWRRLRMGLGLMVRSPRMLPVNLPDPDKDKKASR